MNNGPDYILDISGLQSPASAPREQPALQGRPWLAVHWRCCGVYNRIYRNAEGTRYEGKCPACTRPIHVGVGAHGTDSRFFEAW